MYLDQFYHGHFKEEFDDTEKVLASFQKKLQDDVMQINSKLEKKISDNTNKLNKVMKKNGAQPSETLLAISRKFKTTVGQYKTSFVAQFKAKMEKWTKECEEIKSKLEELKKVEENEHEDSSRTVHSIENEATTALKENENKPQAKINIKNLKYATKEGEKNIKMNFRALEHKQRREVKTIRHKLETNMREQKQFATDELEKFNIEVKKEFTNSKEEIETFVEDQKAIKQKEEQQQQEALKQQQAQQNQHGQQ